MGCTCEKVQKIPSIEIAYLINQRTIRKMVVGKPDLKTSRKQQKSEKQRQQETIRKCRKEVGKNKKLIANQVEVEVE